MKKELDQILNQTIQHCFQEGVLKAVDLPDYVIEVPNNPDHGDFATNLPMALASSQKRNPRDIAQTIVDHLDNHEALIEKTEIAGPGFINFTLKKKKWFELLHSITTFREDFGRNKSGDGKKLLVEFVSANPTGPLHLGHGRGAALGDTLCRVLSFCGYNVVREFYINDAGQQVRLLGESIYSRWRQVSDPGYPFPENGYHGDYIVDLAQEISAEKDLSALEPEDAVTFCTERGKERMLSEIRQDLVQFGMDFDVWYSETDLFQKGLVEKALQKIKDRGELYEKDGAAWIQTSAFGDDKDRVIRKSDGQYTYFASDISYHLDKWERGFSQAVNIWGADHHGYVQRVKAALKANGIDENWLSVLLVQLVKLWEGGQEIRMSKRAGQYITLKELVEEVGVDAVRFVFLTKNHDSPLDVDMDLIKKHDSDNPVYYVQYAHARICSIFRKAKSEGIEYARNAKQALEGLILDEEMHLIRLMAEFPSLITEICKTFEAHRLTYYLTELAGLFHKYFNLGNQIPENRIVTGDASLTQARLTLVDAIRIVIFNGLKLLGVHAPDRM
jgi:arginyl-tRNA synthetase